MATILVTGASRGLGLELVRQYAEDGDRVFACCREPKQAHELEKIAGSAAGRVSVHRLEVTDWDRVRELAGEITEPIDVLINNAGIMKDREWSGFGEINPDGWLQSFRVNAVAPIKIAEAFAGHVARSDLKKIVVVTSLMGSIADNTGGGYYAYRSSKAAVNMAMKSASIDLGPRGILCAVLHPGWVKTDMGTDAAPLDRETSVAGMRAVIASLTQEKSGCFFRYDGTELPW